MTMGLKSRILVGSMVEIKIMYYSFLFNVFLIWWLKIIVSIAGRLVHGFEASLQRSQSDLGV